MNKQKLLDLINNPNNLSQSDVDNVLEIVSNYPYFQIGHALIAKFKSDNKTLDYRGNLHLASITSANRNVLKALIQGDFDTKESEPASIIAESVTTSTELADEPVNDENVATSEVKSSADERKVEEKETLVEEQKLVEPDKQVIPNIEAAQSENEAGKEMLIGDLKIKSGDNPDKLNFEDNEADNPNDDPKDDIYKELEENLRSLQRRKKQTETQSAAYSTKATAEDSTTGRTATPKKTTASKAATATGSKSTKAATTSNKTARQPTAKVVKTVNKPASTKAKSTNPGVTIKKPTTKSTTTSSTKATPTGTKKTSVKAVASSTRKGVGTKSGALKSTAKADITKKITSTRKSSAKNIATPKSSVKTKVSSTKGATVTSKKKLQKKVNKSIKGTTKDKADKSGKDKPTKNQIKIIEDFIKKEPRISKPKPGIITSDTPQEDLSLNSIEIKEDLISENLAIIMVKQGKTQKAKDIYKKLIWKFPQKKAYFASRIEELDKS